MGTIKLDIEQMYNMARKYDYCIRDIESLINNLDHILVELQMYWEGVSAKRFEAEYLNIKPQFMKMQELIIATSNMIKYTASTISEVDNSIIG